MMPAQLDPKGDAIRVHIDYNQPLPDLARCLHPPCFDADDNATYFASATLGNTAQPCRVTCKGGELICTVPHRLMERTHQGPFTILPFTEDMELVPTSHGRIPVGRRPVVGGLDEKGRRLYHAVAWVDGERALGRTSEHLGAAAVLFGGREHYVYNAHEILCWRDDADVSSSGSVPPGPVVPDVSTNRAPTSFASLGQTKPDDPFGMGLRVIVPDLSLVRSYPATTDLDGSTLLYFGSAILPDAIIPGKVVGMSMCQVLRDDAIVERTTGFSILPFNSNMELIHTRGGEIPHERRPVEGNCDSQGRKLYHAMLYVVGRKFPGVVLSIWVARKVFYREYSTNRKRDTISCECWKEHPNKPSLIDLPLHYVDAADQRVRVPLNGNDTLTTDMARTFGEHICNELDDKRCFFASVLYQGTILPTWAYPDHQPCSFAREDGTVMACTGPYCVLPYSRNRMVLVPASDGKVPDKKTPVEGGKDSQGRLLYHAVGWVSSGMCRARMIGMAAEHLGGAVIVCWGNVNRISSGYELL